MSSAIIADKLSKKYRIGSRIFQPGTIGESLWKNFSSRGQKEDLEFWALKNVSFELEHGNILGIIGRNGAGKSTLLKILSRITPPSSGKAEINGRVASLLEVGTGFHPQLSGRENVYLNGTLLGMRKKEVDSRLEEIVEFAEVGKFLDTPIKKFSSGMKVRLAFSVAAHLRAEILIVDEVLAVGDAAFQQKCIGKMNEVAGHGKTVLLVSHNMSAVKNLSTKCIYLKAGEKAIEGRPDDVIKSYLNENLSAQAEITTEEIYKAAEHVNTYPQPTFLLEKIAIKDKQGNERKEFLSDEEVDLEMIIEVRQEIKDLQLIFSLVNEDGLAILSTNLTGEEVGNEAGITPEGKYVAVSRIPANLLAQNQYFISVTVVNPTVEHLILTKGLFFNVTYKREDNHHIGKLAEAWLRPKTDWRFHEINDKPIQNIFQKTA